MITTPFLNTNIQIITRNELLNNLTKGVLITPNVDHLVKLQKDKEFYDVYQQAEWVICDSKILYLLSKLLKYPLPEEHSYKVIYLPPRCIRVHICLEISMHQNKNRM